MPCQSGSDLRPRTYDIDVQRERITLSGLRIAALLSAIVLALALVAGCGGGGGGGNGGTVIDPPPPVGNSRTLTGTVVGSVSGTGVANVLVRLNTSYWAATDSTGKFQIDIGEATELPTQFEVSTSTAGAAYPSSALVTYKDQTYLPGQIDMPVDVLNGVTANMGTITVFENPDGNTVPPSPYPSKDTVIIGRVVLESKMASASLKRTAGIENVIITFGKDAIQATTGKFGYFAVNLGRDVPVVSVFPTNTWVQIGDGLVPTFVMQTSAGSAYQHTEVKLNGIICSQGYVVLPKPVFAGETTVLGDITVLDVSGGWVPPPPPGP